MANQEREFRRLSPAKIAETTGALRARIEEHFPGSGLAAVAAECTAIAERAGRRTEAIYRPNVPLRIGVFTLVGAMLALLAALVWTHRWDAVLRDLPILMQTLDAALGSLFFLGAAVVFLVTLELRLRRSRALEAMAEIRAMAHIVDMHQLAKSPEHFVARRFEGGEGRSSVRSPADLSRYLECCSELLSLMSKLCAVYLGTTSDAVLLAAVDDIEDLTGGLSHKMWQKIMILGEAARGAG
jgi:hypothetical protein